MIRITYDSDDFSGDINCPFCGKSLDLPHNVRAWLDGAGIWHTEPEAWNVVYSHFHYDENAHIAECSALATVENDTWEAVDKETKRVVARGRIVVTQRTIDVSQDDPVRF